MSVMYLLTVLPFVLSLRAVVVCLLSEPGLVAVAILSLDAAVVPPIFPAAPLSTFSTWGTCSHLTCYVHHAFRLGDLEIGAVSVLTFLASKPDSKSTAELHRIVNLTEYQIPNSIRS